MFKFKKVDKASILFDNEKFTQTEKLKREMCKSHELSDNYGFMRVLGLEDVKIIKMSERQWSNNTHQKWR